MVFRDGKRQLLRGNLLLVVVVKEQMMKERGMEFGVVNFGTAFNDRLFKRKEREPPECLYLAGHLALPTGKSSWTPL